MILLKCLALCTLVVMVYTMPDCTDIYCPPSHIPVCGSNGETYPSECHLRASNCKRPPHDRISIDYPGECRDIPNNCPKFCPLVWAPLCGTDKVTYGNPCQLEVTNCSRKPEERVQKNYEGVCRKPH
ncbi:unnamed protein product [Lymnaea stagnalis]|uniref:Kazal-like domain-containing protein n=1 Tax=Lymnaea stagnalis TaxID=6523 RepID=A0AAV2I0X0_LYMST